MNKENSRDRIICRCEEITEGQILDAIERGDTTLDAVKRRTRSGMGLCQGKTCARLVARLICEQTSVSMAAIDPPRKRQPVNPISLGTLASGAGRETVTRWDQLDEQLSEEEK